jgi:hypothetical protein
MTDERGALFCKSCGARLTAWLTPIRDPAELWRLGQFGQTQTVKQPVCPVPPGRALMVSSEVLSVLRADHGLDLTEGGIWLHLSDLLAEVGYAARRRIAGCCGLDGMDGPNRACPCGAEVGTERSDCWTWHYFAAEPATTEWKT